MSWENCRPTSLLMEVRPLLRINHAVLAPGTYYCTDYIYIPVLAYILNSRESPSLTQKVSKKKLDCKQSFPEYYFAILCLLASVVAMYLCVWPTIQAWRAGPLTYKCRMRFDKPIFEEMSKSIFSRINKHPLHLLNWCPAHPLYSEEVLDSISLSQ